MMANVRPRLRPFLQATPEDDSYTSFILSDYLRLSPTIRLNALELHCLRLLDGQRSLLDIHSEITRVLGGRVIPLQDFYALIDNLDQALFLDTHRFHDRANAPVRPPSCLGVYSEDPDVLRRQMRQLFTHPQAAGLPTSYGSSNPLRAVLSPHIDYTRGGISYTYAFRELVEQTSASLFVIVGTSHYAGNYRFTLTRKHFQTPLGIVPTDQHYIDRLVAHYGDGLFDGEWIAHFPEHSIELEVIPLQYLYEGRRDIRIVPLVVGSFHDCVATGNLPEQAEDIRRMVQAMQAVEREMNEPICYIISGDLAHIGPKFDDPQPVYRQQLEHSRRQDQALLEQVVQADQTGYFRILAEEGDQRRICGFPPTWLVMAVTQPRCGKLLHYAQYVHPQGYESVSFASVGLYA